MTFRRTTLFLGLTALILFVCLTPVIAQEEGGDRREHRHQLPEGATMSEPFNGTDLTGWKSAGDIEKSFLATGVATMSDQGFFRSPKSSEGMSQKVVRRVIQRNQTNKSIEALKRTNARRLCVGGGVAANSCFREAMEIASQENGFELFIPPLSLCTDNAVMGAIAVERFKAGEFESLDLDIKAGLVR